MAQTSTANTDTSLKSYITFATNNIEMLHADAFQLDTPLLITLKDGRCTVIFFYGQLNESLDFMKIYASVAEEAAGPRYAACNIVENKRVAEAFAAVSSDTSHPFHAFGLKGWPRIIGYRNGSPVSNYNGDYNNNSLADWALIDACQGRYREPEQLAAGIRYDEQITEEKPRPYVNIDGEPPIVKRSSIDFTADTPVRTLEGGGRTTTRPGTSAPAPAPVSTPNRAGRVLPAPASETPSPP